MTQPSKICRSCGGEKISIYARICHSCGNEDEPNIPKKPSTEITETSTPRLPPLRPLTELCTACGGEMAYVYEASMRCRSCGASKYPWNHVGIIDNVPKWVLDMACKVGLHRGDWIYNWRPSDVRPKYCAQTRICKGCGRQSGRTEHTVRQWKSNRFSEEKTESGVCDFCNARVTRPKHEYHGGAKR